MKSFNEHLAKAFADNKVPSEVVRRVYAQASIAYVTEKQREQMNPHLEAIKMGLAAGRWPRYHSSHPHATKAIAD
jgi:hypothetical protein